MLDCIICNENEAIDGVYCFSCGIDIYYSERDPELVLDWKD